MSPDTLSLSRHPSVGKWISLILSFFFSDSKLMFLFCTVDNKVIRLENCQKSMLLNIGKANYFLL